MSDKTGIAATAPVTRDDFSSATPMPWGDVWRSRPFAASLVRVMVVAVPLALAQVITLRLAYEWARPQDLVSLLRWWLGLSIIAMVTVESVLVVTRRLLPLAVLLRLQLAFPTVAPSRYRTALRSGSPRSLERMAATDREAVRAATAMLALVADLTKHDRATRGHSERVRAYAELIAEELDLPADDRHRLRWGALLHDVGKLRTPESILNKETSLTADEYETIKRHPLDGLELAVPVWPWLGPWALAISDHHERWEGGGYPSGVSGEEIALAGRIVAVADAYDVMTSARSYKAPISMRDACTELVRCSGTQFEPAVVRAFLAIPPPRLRAVAGPLSTFAPMLTLPRKLEQLRNGAHLATGAAAVAIVGIASLVAPVQEEAAAAPAEQPTVAPAHTSGSDRGTGGFDFPPVVPSGSAERGETRPTSSRPPAAGNGAPDPPLATTDPEQARPSPDPPATPPPGGAEPTRPGDPGGRRDPLAISFSPRTGEVTVEGVAAGDIPVADLDGVGAVACNGAGMCDDIVVETPIVLPKL